jgi:hypothetical protein
VAQQGHLHILIYMPNDAALQIIALVMSRGVLVHVPQRYWHFVAACCLPVVPESGTTVRALCSSILQLS